MFILVTALIASFNASPSVPLREQQFQLSIDRGALASVLEQVAAQTGLQIGRQISAEKSRAIAFGPFVGRATADEAMRELLKDTDLWYAWRADDTIRVFLNSAQRMTS